MSRNGGGVWCGRCDDAADRITDSLDVLISVVFRLHGRGESVISDLSSWRCCVAAPATDVSRSATMSPLLNRCAGRGPATPPRMRSRVRRVRPPSPARFSVIVSDTRATPLDSSCFRDDSACSVRVCCSSAAHSTCTSSSCVATNFSMSPSQSAITSAFTGTALFSALGISWGFRLTGGGFAVDLCRGKQSALGKSSAPQEKQSRTKTKESEMFLWSSAGSGPSEPETPDDPLSHGAVIIEVHRIGFIKLHSDNGPDDEQPKLAGWNGAMSCRTGRVGARNFESTRALFSLF